MGSLAPAALVAPQVTLPASSQANALLARADTAYTTEWDVQEQASLEATLGRYPADRHPPLERYVRAAAGLPKKNVRDVALRVAWMRATAAARKRKAADEANSKKQVRRERGQSIFAVQPKAMGASLGPHPLSQHSMGMGMGGAPTAGMGMMPGMAMPGSSMMQPPGMAFAPPVVPMAPPLVAQLDDHGAGTVGVVGGPLSQLLEQNYAILNQFKQNMEVYKVNENTELLVRFRDNILTVLNQMNAMQGVMQQMPPLPVRLNVELANNFLPKAVANGVCQMPYMAAPMHGMPQMPMMSQQGSGAVPQASMPYPVASSAAPGLAAPTLAQQPGMNGISAPAPAAAASAGRPAACPTLPTAVPTSMPALSSIPAAMPANSYAQSRNPAAADMKAPSSQAPPVQASASAPLVKVEPGMMPPGSLPMPGGPAASAALYRPSLPVKTESQSCPGATLGAAAAGQGGTMPPGSTMLHSSTAPVAAPAAPPQLPQQQQAQPRAPAVSMALPDPTKAPLDVLFPGSSATQQAAVQEPNTSAGGLYDVLASITANAPGMLQPAMPQPFPAPQPASAALASAAQAAPQPQASPAAPAAGVQQLPSSSAPPSASGPHPVIQTGQLQHGGQQQQQQNLLRSQPQVPVYHGATPQALPQSQPILSSTSLPCNNVAQGHAPALKAPMSHPVLTPPQPGGAQQQEQQQQQAVDVQPRPTALPVQTPTSPADAAAQSAITPSQNPQLAASQGGGSDSAQLPMPNNQQQRPPQEPAPKQAPQPAVAAPAQPASAPTKTEALTCRSPKAAAPVTAPAKASAPVSSTSKAAAAAISAAPALAQQPAPAAASAPSVSPQKAGPSVGTRSSSAAAQSPARPQRATRSTAGRRG